MPPTSYPGDPGASRGDGIPRVASGTSLLDIVALCEVDAGVVIKLVEEYRGLAELGGPRSACGNPQAAQAVAARRVATPSREHRAPQVPAGDGLGDSAKPEHQHLRLSSARPCDRADARVRHSAAVVSEIDDALRRAREDLLEVTRRFDPRLLALSAVRMADWAFMMPLADPEQPAHTLAAAYGAPLILATVPPGSLRGPGWPAVVSDAELEGETHAILERAGSIAMVERTLALVRSGLGSLEERGGRIVLEYARDTFDLERHDKQDERDRLAEVRAVDDEESETLRRMQPLITSLTSKLVGRWRKHFIRYDADPVLDNYFMRAAKLRCRYSMYTQDSFDGEATFDGIPFYVYRAVVLTLTALSLKHAAFALALLNRHRDMRPPNVLTIVDEPRKLVPGVTAHLDADDCVEDITAALRAVTLVQEHDAELLIPGEGLPPLIEIGDGFLIRSMEGTLGSPFYYLLKHLRRRFRKDWDVAVNRREAELVRSIESLFPRAEFRIGRAGAQMRDGSNLLTDIDAAVFEPAAKTLAVFQLKWQDPFGLSVAARRSAATNFVKTGGAWVEKVLGWTARNGVPALQRTLRLPVEEVTNVRLFVIARAHANFSGAYSYDERASWGNWPQLARLRSAHASRPEVLNELHRAISDEFRSRRKPDASSRQLATLDIGTTTVEIVAYGGA